MRMTYSSCCVGSNRHCPCGTRAGCFGSAVHPDVVVFVAVAGGSVPVAASVVGHICSLGFVVDFVNQLEKCERRRDFKGNDEIT